MTLQEVLSAIKTAVYGEDVRNAILGGLELCYSERLSGGYNPVDDLNNYMNGTTFFDSGVENRPFNGAYLLMAGGNDEECCQVAIDPSGVNSSMIRCKENGSWSTWTNVVETTVYQVRYYNYDGSDLLYTEKVSEGGNAAWNGAPERESSVQYDYIFLGWNLRPNQTEISEGALRNLTASVDVYAAYRQTVRSYYVYFYNGSELFDSKLVVYGGNAQSPSTDPTKEPSAQYTYSFVGWNEDPNASTADTDALNNVTGDRNVYAMYSSTIRSYTVSFRNGSTELQSVTVPYGGTAVYKGEAPTKESTEQYTYSFVGWNTEDGATVADPNATRNIASDTILYAAFSTTALAYTVRFMNGAEPLETISVEYGNDAVYSGDTPEKDETDQYTYSFIGWNRDPNASAADANALRNITTDLDIYAVYMSTVRSYTVTFMNGDALLTSVSVPYGGTASYSGAVPTKASSEQYTYTFAGWSKQPNQSAADADALTNIISDRTVYAAFGATVRTYIVRFIDDGTILETKNVPYGDDVVYTGEEPERADTAQYNYTFVGWNSSPNQTVKDDTVLQNITANRDIYAAYSMVIQTYIVSFCKDSIIKRGVVQGTTSFRAMLDLYPCEIGLDGHISSWSEYLEYGKTYQIQFATDDSNISLYVEDSNGSQSYTGNTTFYVEEGDSWCLWIELAANASFEDSSFTISMTDGESSTNLMPLFAQYPTSVARTDLSISWGPDVYDYQRVPYDSNVTYAGVTPTKAPTSEYVYRFVGWSEYEGQSTADPTALQNIQANKTLYPAFAESSATVTVRFYYNVGSAPLDIQTVPIGDTVVYGGIAPTKQSVAQYNYVFNGWNEDENQTAGTPGILENVTQDLDLYAAFLPVTRTYTVRFLNGSTELQSSQVEYGGSAVYSGAQPTKESIVGYDYRFVGWALQDGQTEADASALMDIVADRTIYAAFEAVPIRTYIYGIKRLYGSTDPAWTRLDDSVGLTATATYGSMQGHSDFDALPIYKDIKRVTFDTGDVMVQIPKFYFQRYLEMDEDGNGNTDQYEYIRICKEPQEGFSIHPAFTHNGTVQDYIYVGAYLSSVNNATLWSLSGKKPFTLYRSLNEATKKAQYYRDCAAKKGSGWGEFDISTHAAIQMLYLIEYATNGSQTAVGKGCCHVSTLLSTGGCDIIYNLTGGDVNTDYTKQVVYRGIEDLWGNGLTFVDGVQSRVGRSLYVSTQQSNYSSNTNAGGYTALSYTTTNVLRPVMKMGLDPDNPAYMFSIEANTQDGESIGYCDAQQIGSSDNYTYSAITCGGFGNSYSNGIFYYVSESSSSEDVSLINVTSRLLYIPSSS